MEDQGQLVYLGAFNKSQLLLSRVFGLETSSTIPASATTPVHGSPDDDDKVTRDTVPNTLVRMVEWTPLPDRGQASYGICHGMMTLANLYPTYIDDFLTIYLEAIALSPSQLLNSSDHTLAFQLVMNMTETANTGYRTNDWCKTPGVFRPGNNDLANASNIIFERSDVEEHVDHVVKVILQQAKEGNDYIVRAGMYARYSSLMKAKKLQWFEGFEVHDYSIEFQLRKEVGVGGWIKEELIAALNRLRGYAQSLSDKFSMAKEAKGRMKEWQNLLKRWIYDPELDKTRDLMVKYHVIVSPAVNLAREALWLTYFSWHLKTCKRDLLMRREMSFSGLKIGFSRLIDTNVDLPLQVVAGILKNRNFKITALRKALNYKGSI